MSRDCIYDEAYTVLLSGYEDKRRVLGWCHYLRMRDYPRHLGLLENCLIFRRHCDAVSAVESQWWILLETVARRDQLFLSYVFWSLPGLKKGWICSIGGTVWNIPSLKIFHHRTGNNKNRSPYHSYFGYVQLRFMNRCKKMKHLFYDIFYSLSKHNIIVSQAVLYCMALLVFVIYAPFVYVQKVYVSLRKQK